MKLFSFLTITHMAVAQQQQTAAQIQEEVAKWSPSGKTCDGKSGFAPGKCDNERGFCCNVNDTESCADNQLEELKKRFDNFAHYREDQENKFGGWQCVVPKRKKTAKQRAQIEKCLKSFDPTIYKSDHGKIGNFHKTLAKIMSDRVDRPGWQCSFLRKLRNGFYDYLKLRKECAGKANTKSKKANNKQKKQAARDKAKDEQAKKKAENEEKRLQREQAKADKEQEESRKRREDEETEEESVANVDDFVFNDDGSNEVADSTALKELNKIVDQLKGIEDTEDYTADDLQALYNAECTGKKVDDQKMCDDIANVLSGDNRNADANDVLYLRKAALARKGIAVWSQTYIPKIGSCNKRRQQLVTQTRLIVDKLIDMRMKYKTNPQKQRNQRNQKKAKEQKKIQRAKDIAQRKKDQENKVKERTAKVEQRNQQKAAKQESKEQAESS